MITTRAPAKVNLYLEVLGRRPDGFHEIATVMTELHGLADVVSVEAGDEGVIECVVRGAPEAATGAAAVPDGPENLAHRAATALRDAAERPELGARITIEKAVPAGGGLGGGSSDAAATLRALATLWRLDAEWSPERLAGLAGELGSDCPFFVRGGTAVCTGRGERVASAPGPSAPVHLVLHVPAVSVPTPKVYRAWAETAGIAADAGVRAAPDVGLARLGDAFASGDAAAVAAALRDDLEAPAFALFPELAAAKARLLDAGLLGALLSGSGATVFGVARDEGHARAVADALVADGVSPTLLVRAGGEQPAE